MANRPERPRISAARGGARGASRDPGGRGGGRCPRCPGIRLTCRHFVYAYTPTATVPPATRAPTTSFRRFRPQKLRVMASLGSGTGRARDAWRYLTSRGPETPEPALSPRGLSRDLSGSYPYSWRGARPPPRVETLCGDRQDLRTEPRRPLRHVLVHGGQNAAAQLPRVGLRARLRPRLAQRPGEFAGYRRAGVQLEPAGSSSPLRHSKVKEDDDVPINVRQYRLSPGELALTLTFKDRASLRVSHMPLTCLAMSTHTLP